MPGLSVITKFGAFAPWLAASNRWLAASDRFSGVGPL